MLVANILYIFRVVFHYDRLELGFFNGYNHVIDAWSGRIQQKPVPWPSRCSPSEGGLRGFKIADCNKEQYRKQPGKITLDIRYIFIQ
jgi:hypothetical protein